jgi:tripartite-type tricarboxylate transporter receptor subunit TctC
MMAPSNTPKAITQKLHREILKALSDESIKEQLILQGLSPRGSSPDELAASLEKQLVRYEKLIKQAEITAD